MNQRIQELAEQAEIKFESHPQHQGVDTAVIIPTDLKKFAELIVRECVSTLGCEIVYNDNYTEKNKIISDMMELLKQHFGVEE